jgi:hypothetical protein
MSEMTKMSHVWHFFYRHWYDNDRAGHPRRAAFWGWLAALVVDHA